MKTNGIKKETISLETIEQLTKIVDVSKGVVIYGAGQVASVLLQWIKETCPAVLSRINCIFVCSPKDNPSVFHDIAVKELKFYEELCDAHVIVATGENYQKEILEALEEKGYRTISTVSAQLCEELYCDTIYHHDSHLLPQEYEQAITSWYNKATGTPLDLSNPQTFNEKIQWIKLYGVTPHMTRLTDKYLVREWIKEQIGEKYLVPLLGVWNSFDEIDITALPNQFVLKCNHGCGWNEIVKDKAAWNVAEAKKKFDKWMYTNYAFVSGLQLQYKDIVPKIIAEAYLENKEGDLYDYKFWCFHGKAKFVMFLSERAKKLRMNNYDKEWRLLPFVYDYTNTDDPVPRPEKLEEMIVLAEKLAAGFPHVRVDFYQLNDGTIQFGEMTFTSANGACKWSNEDINRKLGELIKL